VTGGLLRTGRFGVMGANCSRVTGLVAGTQEENGEKRRAFPPRSVSDLDRESTAPPVKTRACCWPTRSAWRAGGGTVYTAERGRPRTAAVLAAVRGRAQGAAAARPIGPGHALFYSPGARRDLAKLLRP